jgi:FAD/FMN-containing dehydrogenase
MNSVEVIPNTIDVTPHADEASLLRFGAGNTFEKLIDFVDQDEFSFVHGECWSVGVGGFFLHGGLHAGALTDLYGYGNETLRSLIMVTANGTKFTFTEPRQRISDGESGPARYTREPVLVKDANGQVVTGYEELWDAIRCAGSSFGIVTEMTIQLYSKPEPYVWFIHVRLDQERSFKLFNDAALDDQVTLHLYYVGGYEGVLQMSLRDGSTRPAVNYRQCLNWLGKWFRSNGMPLWRLTRYFLSSNTALSLATRIQLGGIQGRKDLGGSYPESGGWVSSSLTVPLSSPNKDAIMAWYRQKTGTTTDSDCWLLFQALDTRYSAGDRTLYVDYTCSPAENYKEYLRDMEREIQTLFPEAVRYVNVPIDMVNDEENDNMVTRYYHNHEQLSSIKTMYDPDSVFAPFQGIKPL